MSPLISVVESSSYTHTHTHTHAELGLRSVACEKADGNLAGPSKSMKASVSAKCPDKLENMCDSGSGQSSGCCSGLFFKHMSQT